jgi:hypothetical protein
MEQRPCWEAKSFSASQEISRILWNPDVHCRIHDSPPPVPIETQLNPLHASQKQNINTWCHFYSSWTDEIVTVWSQLLGHFFVITFIRPNIGYHIMTYD